MNRPPACKCLSNLKRLSCASILLIFALFVLSLVGCAVEEALTVDTPVIYEGPRFLYGSVGSIVTVEKNQYQLVSGFGLVGNLKGTGDTDLPPQLRRDMIQIARKIGERKAASLIDSDTTGVVVVHGLIPAGAVRGSRFDLLVSAHPDTETTSLQGGQLWSAPLGVGGASEGNPMVHKRASARGAIYINPLESTLRAKQREDDLLTRHGVVLSGGVVVVDRAVELVLNQPSYTRARQIADRINSKFRRSVKDRNQTAIAKSSTLVMVYVPHRFGDDPSKFIHQIKHLYLAHGRGYEVAQAKTLAKHLIKYPNDAKRVGLAWQGLGKKAWGVIRKFYTHSNLTLRLAALEAGIRGGDEIAVAPLIALTTHKDPHYRKEAVALLHFSPRKSLAVMGALKGLLSDDDKQVRIEAYKSSARIYYPVESDEKTGGPLVYRMLIGSELNRKFILDLVRSDKPLVYVSQAQIPTIAIFSPDVGFKMPIESRVWDGHLLVNVKERLVSVDSKVPNTPPIEQLQPQMSVFYKDRYTRQSDVYIIAPTIANFIFLLAHTPTDAKGRQGLDLSYSQVVSALHEYSKLGVLEAPIEMELSPLAQQIADLTKNQDTDRPDRDDTAIDGEGEDEASPNGPPAGEVDRPESSGADRPESAPATNQTRPDGAASPAKSSPAQPSKSGTPVPKGDDPGDLFPPF
jgi:hypothetical protein